jgi:hypothetical protein
MRESMRTVAAVLLAVVAVVYFYNRQPPPPTVLIQSPLGTLSYTKPQPQPQPQVLPTPVGNFSYTAPAPPAVEPQQPPAQPQMPYTAPQPQTYATPTLRPDPADGLVWQPGSQRHPIMVAQFPCHDALGHWYQPGYRQRNWTPRSDGLCYVADMDAIDASRGQ